jgi:hypothetical protein
VPSALKALNLAALLCLAVMLGAASFARADLEPNQPLPHAEGPLAGGATYSGTAPSETDWYFFYVTGGTELDIAITLPASEISDSCFSASLYGRDGDTKSLASSQGYYQGTTQHLLYRTPPGTPQLYYFTATSRECEHLNYGFQIGPSASIVAGPNPFASPVMAPEPNESRQQAAGPLAGGTVYSGVKSTINDADWFYFFARGSHVLEISLTSESTMEYGECENLTVTDSSGKELGRPFGSSERVGRLLYTTPPGRPQRYFIEVNCQSRDPYGESYLFRIDPADAVLADGLPSAPQACIEARSHRRHARGKLMRARSKLRHARSSMVRRELLRHLHLLRRKLRHAQRQVVSACG